VSNGAAERIAVKTAGDARAGARSVRAARNTALP